MGATNESGTSAMWRHRRLGSTPPRHRAPWQRLLRLFGAFRLWRHGPLCVLLYGLLSLGASCGQLGVTLLPGVINDPANRSLRRALLGYATEQICEQMVASSVPLRLRDADPATGRFFPRACNVQRAESGNLVVQFLGRGYVWTNVTGRVGFEARAAVEYSEDFLADGSSLYVYFRQQRIYTQGFDVQMVEKAQGSLVSELAGVVGTTVKRLAQSAGTSILRHELARGFTVIRDGNDSVVFAPGLLLKGERPPAPFGQGDSDWRLLANERIELHDGQRDFAGPFEVSGDDEALWLTSLVEGAPAVDLLVMTKTDGDRWLERYLTKATPTPPSGPALAERVLSASFAPPAALSAPVSGLRQAFVLPAGSYYLVFDNTHNAGRTSPAGGPLDDRAATIRYAVQLGSRP